MSPETPTPVDDPGSLSNAAVLFRFRDACTRLGKLEQKQFVADLYGIHMDIPQEVTDQVELYGAEAFKRMQG